MKIPSILKLFAILLAFAILLQVMPMSAFASIAEEFENQTSAENIIYENNERPEFKSNAEVFEVNELRQSDEKTFRLTDGMFYVAHYDTDVHELNESGEWTNIDNRLYDKNGNVSTDNGKYSFPSKTSKNSSLFSLNDKIHSVSFTLADVQNGIKGVITNKKTEIKEDADRLDVLKTLDNIKSSVLYKNILPGTDIEYVLYGSKIKENIIITEKSLEYKYNFILNLHNLIPVVEENGEISLLDSESGETVYRLPAPTMWDSAGECSNDVSYMLSDNGEGSFVLSVAAEAGWINDESRAFPVTIDPPIYSASSNTLDTAITSLLPTGTYATMAFLDVCPTWRSYWKLTTLPSLPQSAYITRAEISMHAYTNNSMVDGYVAAYEVLTDWDAALTWNSATASSNPSGQMADTFTDYTKVETFYSPGSYSFPNDEFTWNITPIVKKWYTGDNFGVAFAAPSGASFTGLAQFRSNDYSTASVRPSLCITYSDMKGLEDYWSYTAQDAGFAGQAYINNATGNLVVNIPTLTTTDFLMPITPSLVYNHCMYFNDYTYPYAQTANTTAFTPKSCKLNINETLIKKWYINQEGDTAPCYIWADGDGTEHYFFPKEDSLDYEDEDGLHLTLSVSTSSCTMTDSNGTVKTFSSKTHPSGVDGAWYLSRITDKSGNALKITVDSSYRPTKLYLVPNNSSDIEQMRFLYNSAGVLYAVYNPSSAEGVVFRYSNTYGGDIGTSYGKYLKRVIRAHGAATDSAWLTFYNTNGVVSTSSVTVDAVAEYKYNYTGIMTEISNTLSGYRLIYNVYGANNKVSKCQEYSITASSNGQKLDYTYGTSSTIIQTSGKDDVIYTSDDLVTTYSFDNYGRVISCYTTDLNKTQIYGASGSQYVSEDDYSDSYSPNSVNSLKSSVQTTQQSSNYLYNGGFESGSLQYWSKTGSVYAASTGTNNNLYSAELILNSGVSSSSIYQYVDLDKGDYTLSFDFFTDDIPSGVVIYAKAESQSNSAHSVTKQLSKNENLATGGYTFDSLSFSASPSTTGGKERFKITVMISGAVSSTTEIYIDNLMLSRTTGASKYDMTVAGHFETSYGRSPSTFWKIMNNETTPISVVDSGNDTFGEVLCVNTPFDALIYPYQVIYQTTNQKKHSYDSLSSEFETPELFTVSGWAKGTGQSYNDSANFNICVDVKYYNGSSTPQTDSFFMEFDKGIIDWQFACESFASDYKKGIVDTVTVYVLYNGHPGVGYFDNISVVHADSDACVYEYGSANGYLSKAYKGSQIINYTYDDDGKNVIGIANTGNHSITEYTYDSLNRLKTETSGKYTNVFNTPDMVITRRSKTTYTYNTYGQITQTVSEDLEDSNTKTRERTTYIVSSGSHVFGAVNTEIDALGNTTRYFYDSSNGRLNAVLAPNGRGTCYTYDGMGNLTETLPAVYMGTTYSTISDSADVEYTYDSTTKRLNSIKANANATNSSGLYSTTYYFSYDGFGNVTETKVGTRTLASYTYNAANGKLNTLVYGNGLNVQYAYDTLERISEIKYRSGSSGSFTTAYSYTYDSAGHLRSVTDHSNNEVTMYEYDLTGKLLGSYVYDSTTNYNKNGTSVYYDAETSKVDIVFNSYDYKYSSGVDYDSTDYSYSYNSNTGNISELRTQGDYISGTVKPVYDNLGRASSRVLDYNVNNSDAFYNKLTYSFESNGSYTSGRVSQVVSEIRKGESTSYTTTTSTYKYTYDANGNITEIKDGSNVTQFKYTYDELGQLTREDNNPLNKSYVYTYDKGGNITSKKTYAFTTGTLGMVQSTENYTYNNAAWGDLLTSAAGKTIATDNIGNTVCIGSDILSWKGRQLSAYYIYGGSTLTYKYNADGIRTVKNVVSGSTTTRHEYLLNGSQIVKETVFVNGTESYTLVYLYDEYGSPIGFKYRTPSYARNVFDGYFFEKNTQGDIIGIWDLTGSNGRIVQYTYDAWGNVTVSGSGASGIGAKNPFRYRGYYYDTETSLYYLQTRYYNPSWGRFISADGYINADNDILGFNMFTYCGNNPVMGYDPTGEWDWGKFINGVTMVATAALCVASVLASVASCGALSPLMFVAATVTIAAAELYALEGVAEMIEAGTDHNFVRDDLLGGDEETYETSKVVLYSIMQIGTMIVGMGACFIAGTQVATEAGNVPIETVQAGDYVWAANEQTGDVGLKQVVRTFIRESDELVHITVDGEEITCTKEHPFYSPRKGWTAACQLRAGDILVTVNGEYVIVEKVQHEILENPVKVYNFEVEGYHTYYVGCMGVLVHNTCSSPQRGFKSSDKLLEHYGKHNSEFGSLFSSPDEYLSGANYVIENGEFVPELNGYIKFFGAGGQANYAFVGLTQDGAYITTFGIRSVAKLAKSISWLVY